MAIAVFVLVLATLGTAAARADEVSPAATSSAEPTPEATPIESAVASDPGDSQVPASDEPTAVPEVPTAEEPDGDGSGPMGTGTGGGEGGGTATPTAAETAGTEQAPAEEGTLAAAAAVVRDPRASIGDINCANLTVPVTLDNSRSTETVVFEVLAGDSEEDEPTFEETVPGPAGAIRIMNVSVTEDTQFLVYVYGQSAGGFLPRRFLTSALLTVDCTDDGDAHDPQARIGGLDCVQLELDVTLDNSRSDEETTYVVSAIDVLDLEQTQEQVFTVPAGQVQTVLVPTIENLFVLVVVQDDYFDDLILAEELFRVDCTPGDGQRASIGELNCTNFAVPVTLDNIQSKREAPFYINTGLNDNEEFYNGYEAVFDVAAGAERVEQVPVPNGEAAVLVADMWGDTVAFQILDVDCGRVLAGRAGAQLAATGANGLTLPIAGLAMLAAGGVLSMLGRRHS